MAGLCGLLAAWLPLLWGGTLRGLGAPRANWEQQAEVNCYQGHGAQDLESPTGASCGFMALADCEVMCEQLSGCEAIVVSPVWWRKLLGDDRVHCYRRASVQLDSCQHDVRTFDTWLLTPPPTPPPSPPPSPAPSPAPSPSVSGAFGCGIAIAGDWPNCGAQFSEDYHFDLAALVGHAQSAVGAGPLWRYDWRSSQHPYDGPWTYVAMDWCPHGGVGEHPDPDGPSVGLMGWNEPNVPSQCNQDAGDWNAVGEFVALARAFKARGKFVVSPAPSLDPSWLDTFLGVCEVQGFFGIDFLAYHHYVTCNEDTSGDEMYGEMSAIIESFIGLMSKYNARGFKIQGLWITEIACAPNGGWGQFPYRWVPGKPAQLMGKFVDIQRNYPQLKTWSWFGYNGFGNLWDPKTSALTGVGREYFDNCRPFSHSGRNASRAEEGTLVVV